jgi:hypothetical protein
MKLTLFKKDIDWQLHNQGTEPWGRLQDLQNIRWQQHAAEALRHEAEGSAACRAPRLTKFGKHQTNAIWMVAKQKTLHANG